MKVWVVTKSYPTRDLVDEDLHVLSADVGEVVGVFSTLQKARKCQEELYNQNAKDMVELYCDPIDVMIADWEVE